MLRNLLIKIILIVQLQLQLRKILQLTVVKSNQNEEPGCSNQSAIQRKCEEVSCLH